MRFFISCNPPKSTHQAGQRIIRRKDGTQFIGKFANSKSKAAQQTITALFAPHAPSSPYVGPLGLHVGWIYPWRKSEPKKNRMNGFRWCDTRPDCDNLAKMVKDQLSRLGFWTDDSQVARLVFDKGWGDHPGIFIHIDPLPETSTPAYYNKEKQK